MELDVARIPKAEMHLHVEGAIRRDTYVELQRRDEPSYSLEQSPWHDDEYRFHSLSHFIDTASPAVTQGPEDYKRIAREMFEDLVAQNVIYAEVSIASSRIPVDEIVHAISDAWHEACSNGQLEYGILVGLLRSESPEFATECVHKAIQSIKYGVVGIDLLGNEVANNAAAFSEAFGIARDAGLGLRAHAGEDGGAHSVWEAILYLGVSRIAHGTRAIEDPQLVSYLVETNITLDMCPTSNFRLSVVDSIHEHPLRRFFDSGIKVTVSSDDPLIFNSDLTDELTLLQEVFDFKVEEMLQLTRNAIDGAFLSPEKKNRLHRIHKERYNDFIHAAANVAPDR